MPESKKEDHLDFVCSFCGEQASEIGGMISSQTGAGKICYECLKVIGELQWEEAVETAAKAQGQDASLRATCLMKPQIVSRFVTELVRPVTWSDLGINWICDGCGWRLRLDSSAQPPPEHSYEIVMGSWLDLRVENIPDPKFVTLCNSRWRRLL
jgi:hypothetical protein